MLLYLRSYGYYTQMKGLELMEILTSLKTEGSSSIDTSILLVCICIYAILLYV